MATLSIRIPDALKKKVAAVAREEGVSMNNFICFCLSMGVAQERAASFFSERLVGQAPEEVKRRFDQLMSENRPGRPPSGAETRRAIEAE